MLTFVFDGQTVICTCRNTYGMVAHRVVLSGRGLKGGKRTVFQGRPSSKSGVPKRVIVKQKSNRPQTLNERFTILQRMREQAENQRVNSRGLQPAVSEVIARTERLGV